MLDSISKYVYEVYRLKSVSLAAKNLYISQPALSAAISKAEKELGTPIFNRKTLPFSLTAEGKIFIEAVEKMLEIEEQTADRIRDIREVRGGMLKIATSSHLSFYVIPKILEKFHKNYIHVDVNIILTDTDKLYDMLEKEVADLIFIPADKVPDGFLAETLFTEKFVVAMPLSHPVCEKLNEYCITYGELVERKYDERKEITDMTVFHGVEFIYNPPNTNIHKKSKILFGKANITPYVMANSGRQQLNYNLMKAGFGALLTTDANIATMPPNCNCGYFVLGGPMAKQSFSVVFLDNTDSHSEKIVSAFVSTAKELFNCNKPIKRIIFEEKQK